jgi:hypothetical protein
MAKVAEQHQQTACAPTGTAILAARDDIEQTLNDKFLPALFGIESVSDTKRQLACSRVKHSVLAFPNPATTPESNCKASPLVFGHLVATLHGQTNFRSVDHANVIAQGEAEIRKWSQENKPVESPWRLFYLQSLMKRARQFNAVQMQVNGSLFCLPQSVGRNFLQKSFVMHSSCATEKLHPTPPACCGVCDAPFALQHALACKNGGLVIFRHNEVRDELVNLVGKALTPSAARDEPPSCVKETDKDTPTRHISQSGGTEQTAAGKDEGGDLLICEFWARGADCMLDTPVTDTDAKSCSKQDPAKVLEPQEKEKKRKVWRQAWKDLVTSPLLSTQWMVRLDERPKYSPNV